MRAVPARALLAAAMVAATAAPPAAASDALNGRIAYTTHGVDGTGEIFSLDPDGSDPLRLTEHAGYDAQSDWSPDGRSIVFRRSPATTGFEVWRMTAEGRDETRMTFGLDLPAGAYSSSQPAWAPDGERILFRASGGPYNPAPVFTMPNEPRAEKTLLLQAAQPLWYPQLSPDGSQLLVAVQYPRIRGREDRAVEIADSPFAPPRRVLFDGPKTAPGRVRLGRQLVARRHGGRVRVRRRRRHGHLRDRRRRHRPAPAHRASSRTTTPTTRARPGRPTGCSSPSPAGRTT